MWPIIISIVITAVIVVGGVYWWQNTMHTVQTQMEEGTDIQSEEPPTTEDVINTKVSTPIIEQGYSYDSPQWESFTSDIKLKTGEIVESFYMPKSTSDDNTIFVSTSSNVTGKWPDMQSTNKIYSYNIKNSELIKLYEEQENRLLRTMGIEGTKLIIMYDDIDNSPGPCFSIWANWSSFGYLDVESTSTLKPYTVPDYQVQKGKDEQKECNAEMGF